MLFWVAVVLDPTKKEKEEGKLEEVIGNPELIVAKDDKAAAIKVAASLTDLDLDRTQVIVRPF